MSEQPAGLERMNWTSCLSFTQVFRTFKIACHPGMIGLAVAAVILTGIWGRALDAVWLTRCQPVSNEIQAFWQTPHIDSWREVQLAGRGEEITAAYGTLGRAVPSTITATMLANDPEEAIDIALEDLEQGYRGDSAKATNDDAVADIARKYRHAYERITRLQHAGVFTSLLSFETGAVTQLLKSTATLDLTGKVDEVMHARRGDAARMKAVEHALAAMRAAADSTPAEAGSSVRLEAVRAAKAALRDTAVAPQESGAGALASLVLMARGAQWLITEHPWFAILFGLGKLAIWALFGGAMCRMAAMSYARDERIPIKSALAFARRKYLGFVIAPLLPVGIILVIGLVMAVGGLFGELPYFGDLLAGLAMGLALLGGCAIALVLIGFIAGGSLMWPTVAAEGSDAFDAMSRSYSYVLSRPWRAALYALAAAIYTAVCYLFARFFIFLVLRSTRAFVGAGLSIWTSRPGTGDSTASKIDAIWPVPTFDSFWGTLSPFGYERWFEWLAMIMIKCWVMLVILALCAFLVAMYYGASTIIYLLLRRDVDHTDIEDVETEGELDDDIIQATAPAAAATVPSATAPEGTAPASGS